MIVLFGPSYIAREQANAAGASANGAMAAIAASMTGRRGLGSFIEDSGWIQGRTGPGRP